MKLKQCWSKIYNTKCLCWKEEKIFHQQSQFLPQETRTRSKINPKQKKQLRKEHKSMEKKPQTNTQEANETKSSFGAEEGGAQELIKPLGRLMKAKIAFTKEKTTLIFYQKLNRGHHIRSCSH